MTLQEIKQKILNTIEDYKDEIIAIGEQIKENPEMGYCEEKTSALVRGELEKLGLAYEYPYALTGVKAKALGRNNIINVCIIGEMDAIKCVGSPIANKDGIAHACGHNAQIAAMLGAAMGLVKSGILEYLDGMVTFIATPAEEYIDMEYRKVLKETGKIHYFGGKQQMIAEGAFDDIDMAMMLHALPNEKSAKLHVQNHDMIGFLARTLTFHGKAVHGCTPFDGVNALNAAALAILGVHANRETFREEDKIRIHPIITKGGDVVNSVPDEVVIDTYVRGATAEAIQKGNHVVERAARGAAEMVGAQVSFENMPGYLPMYEDVSLSEIMEENAAFLIGEENLVYNSGITGSTDIGDLSYIMPIIQPFISGFKGQLHSQEFEIADQETAYILPAKLLALTVVDLLYDNAKKAKEIKSRFIPRMTKQGYLQYLEQ